MAKNAAALVTRPALEGNWAEALAAFDTDRQVNGLGLDTRADTVDGLTAMLADSGVEQIAWYGVRLFTDSWTPAQPGAGAGADDQALEVGLRASRRDPYRLMSRLFHLAAGAASPPDVSWPAQHATCRTVIRTFQASSKRNTLPLRGLPAACDRSCRGHRSH